MSDIIFVQPHLLTGYLLADKARRDREFIGEMKARAERARRSAATHRANAAWYRDQTEAMKKARLAGRAY